MIFVIAIGLALPVLATGLIFRNVKATVFAAVIMAGVGIATGNPHFIATDIIAVGFALFIALQFCRPAERARSIPEIPVVGAERPVATPPAPSTKIPDYSILRRELSHEEEDLLRKHLSFYEELELGIRKPESEAQRHFIDVLKGRATPRTSHEVAFLKHIKRRELKK